MSGIWWASSTVNGRHNIDSFRHNPLPEPASAGSGSVFSFFRQNNVHQLLHPGRVWVKIGFTNVYSIFKDALGKDVWSLKIIIVGNGKVGFTLAEHLSQEEHDVTVIDTNDEALRHASDALDVMCVKGNGAAISPLEEAGVSNADVVIAATNLDEINMVCCLTAKRLGAKFTIARVRNVEYAMEFSHLKDELGVDLAINPENATAVEISRLLRFPPAANIETFCRGRV